MRFPEDQLQELKGLVGSDIREFEESGNIYVYIPGLKMPPGCIPDKTDALLCPHTHDGYTSRLFFKDRIQTPKPVNWNGQVFILGHQWHAFSYNNVKNGSLLEMAMNHLWGMVT
ncbi:MAG: hypothetical protein ACYC0N_03040 [Carboxydocellales bacterium]